MARGDDGPPGAPEGHRLPLSVSAPALLVDGSDDRFRRLIYDLFTISVRMQRIRDALAGWMGITGPQYSILMAIGRLQGAAGVPVGAIARHLHVSSAFATVEVGRLSRKGLVVKSTNPDDGRSVLVRLAEKGRAVVESVAPDLRAVNDRFFGRLAPGEFRTLAAVMAKLVADSEEALAYLDALEAQDAPRATSAATASPRISRPDEKSL